MDTKSNNIAVIGFGFSNNYGAILTNYALITYLKSIGKKPVMIDKPKDLINYNFSDITYTEQLEARRFINKYLSNDISKIYKNKYDIRKINKEFSTFIVGSDQVWSNTLYSDASYFTLLTYTLPDAKRISYASSFGCNDWAGSELYDDYDRIIQQEAINNFDFISVREDSGKKIVTTLFNNEAEHVLDSVFLLDMKNYNYLIDNATCEVPKDNNLIYLLEPGEKLLEQIKNFNKTSENHIFITDPDINNNNEQFKDLNFIDASVEDWLKCIKNSNIIITNSFHGVCFSIIFKKQFIYIVDNYRKNWTTRVISLLTLLNIKNRIINEDDNIYEFMSSLNNINYDEVYNLLDKEILKSKNWLNNALLSPKHVKDIHYLINEKLDYICTNIKKQQDTNKEILNNIYYQNDLLRLIFNKSKILRNYYFCKILSKITLGKLKRKFFEKTKKYKDKIKIIKMYS